MINGEQRGSKLCSHLVILHSHLEFIYSAFHIRMYESCEWRNRSKNGCMYRKLRQRYLPTTAPSDRSSQVFVRRRMEPFVLRKPLWYVVQEKCSKEGLYDVQKVVGFSLVELSLDLYKEAESLLEIWKAFTEETDSVLEERRSTPSMLPECPSIRERLVQEIRFLIEHLQEKGKIDKIVSLGQDSSESRKADLVNYVVQTSTGSSRCSSTGSCGRPVSCVSSRDGCVASSTTPPQASSVDHDHAAKLIEQNVKNGGIDAVIQNLREALEEECKQRQEDIKYLQECIEEKAGFHYEELRSCQPEPSLQELRVFRSQLEEDVYPSDGQEDSHQNSKQAEIMQSDKNLMRRSDHEKRPSTAQRFRAMVAKARNQGDESLELDVQHKVLHVEHILNS